MLVFRPDLDEVMVGKIKNCSKEGVHVSLEFFDDILIPAESLQFPSRYDDSESVWIWEYPLEDDEHHDLFMDAGEQIRFRVTSESFVDSGPAKKTHTASETDVKVCCITLNVHLQIFTHFFHIFSRMRSKLLRTV